MVVASEMALPEIELRRCTVDLEPDLIVVLGNLSEPPEIAEAPYLQVETDCAIAVVPGVGRYRIDRGREILVESDPDADPASVRLFLLGSIMGVIFHQRGILALHASAVEFKGKAIAFVGNVGQGKSTLAAHCLMHASTRLIADDILAVSFDEVGRPLAHPGMPNLKLWRDALEKIHHSTDNLNPDRLRSEKFYLPMPNRLAERSLPLDRIYVLSEDATNDVPRIEPINGALGAVALIDYTYRMELLDTKTQRASHFAEVTRLAGAVAVRRLTRRRDPAQLEATSIAVLADDNPAMETV
jgi:hypothetical protein